MSGPRRSSPKRSGKKRKWEQYEKTYKKSWESLPIFKGWLMENVNFAEVAKGKGAYCKVCKTGLRAHKTDLERHTERQRHIDSMAELNPPPTQRALTDVGIEVKISNETKAMDIRLAVYIACHSAIKGADHFTDLLKELGAGSPLEKLRMHRTKCSRVILRVVAPALLTGLVQDIKDSYGFSLIVDESTDISNKKYLAICVRFFSNRQVAVTTEFLGFLELPSATAVIMKDAIVEYLHKLGLDPQHLIGLGTDGASAMCGRNHSLFTLLRELVPHLQLIKCLCHSLHLCATAASKELPSNLEFMLRESRNWFSHSALRLALYQELFKAINNGQLNKKLSSLSLTRQWLAWVENVKSILEQWVELKSHFQAMALNLNDKCHMARILSEMFKDDANLLYFVFLKPILTEISRVNLLFQSEKADVTSLFQEVRLLLLTLARQILKPSYLKLSDHNYLKQEDLDKLKDTLKDENAYKALQYVDFGLQFHQKLDAANITAENATALKQRCMRYLSRLCNEMADRLPDSVHLIETLKFLSPSECTSQAKQPKSSDLPLFLADMKVDMSILDLEWKKLPLVDWKKHFGTEIPTDACEFWSGAITYKDAGGVPVFATIGAFALRVLSLPFSNAFVERIFSIMNAVKTAQRNKFSLEMLVAVIRVRLWAHKNKANCKDFVPTSAMFQLFNSSVMYGSDGDPVSTPAARHEQDLSHGFMESLTILSGFEDGEVDDSASEELE